MWGKGIKEGGSGLLRDTDIVVLVQQKKPDSYSKWMASWDMVGGAYFSSACFRDRAAALQRLLNGLVSISAATAREGSGDVLCVLFCVAVCPVGSA